MRSYDFVETRACKRRKIKILYIIDEYTRECLASYAALRIRSEDVKNILRNVMRRKGTPEYLRNDNGSEFIAKHLREWLSEMEVAPMYIMPGSPWENGYVESFNGTMANELLNREVFDTLYEAKVLLQRDRKSVV